MVVSNSFPSPLPMITMSSADGLLLRRHTSVLVAAMRSFATNPASNHVSMGWLSDRVYEPADRNRHQPNLGSALEYFRANQSLLPKFKKKQWEQFESLVEAHAQTHGQEGEEPATSAKGKGKGVSDKPIDCLHHDIRRIDFCTPRASPAASSTRTPGQRFSVASAMRPMLRQSASSTRRPRSRRSRSSTRAPGPKPRPSVSGERLGWKLTGPRQRSRLKPSIPRSRRTRRGQSNHGAPSRRKSSNGPRFMPR